MSATDMELPFETECLNCNGEGHIRFDPRMEDHKRRAICIELGFGLLSEEPNKAICLACKGEKKFSYPELQIEECHDLDENSSIYRGSTSAGTFIRIDLGNAYRFIETFKIEGM